jgi:hypothetical protein
MGQHLGIYASWWQARALWPRPGRQLAFRGFIPNVFRMPERIQKPAAPWGPKQGDGDGPRSPDVSRPDTQDLLKKMRKVDPNQSKRYRQRTGQ